MRFGLFVILMIILCPCAKSQDYVDLLKIKNYKKDLVLGIQNERSISYVVSNYGKKESIIGGLGIKYFYQGQEFDNDLGLYFFPSRIYSAIEKHFFQPDPLSQYSSPYILTGGDPVNYIDNDGNEGRPLILHNQYWERSSDGVVNETKDMISEFPDAYFCPMSKFINDEIPDMPDWNGTIFIQTHMTPKSGIELAVEAGNDPSKFYLKASKKIRMTQSASKTGRFTTRISGRDFGGILRRFSSKMRRPLRNVIAGGCQGSGAARTMRDGFSVPIQGEERLSGNVNFYGLREGFDANYHGRLATTNVEKRIAGIDHARFQALRRDGAVAPITRPNVSGGRDYVGNVTRLRNGEMINEPFIEGRDLHNLVEEGIVPRVYRNVFQKFSGAY